VSRKLFFIIIIVLIVVIVGSLVYLLFFSNSPEKTTNNNINPNPNPNPNPAPLPVSSTSPAPSISPSPSVPSVSKVVQVIPNRVLGFALIRGEIIYFDQDLGGFYKAALDGQEAVPASTGKFTSVKNIIWSPDKSQAIMVFDNNDYYHYDLGTGKSTKLMPDISNLSWFPDGKKIVYQWNETSNSAKIIVSNPDGSEWEEIRDLGYTKLILGASPAVGGPAGMVQNYSATSGRNIYPFYIDGSAGETISLKGYGERAKWSRKGERILFEATDATSYENYLWVIDNTGTNQYNLGVKSFIEKCVWNREDEKIVCAVPSEPLNPSSEVTDASTDNFWEINTKTGEKRKLYDESESDTKFDATNLWLNPTEDRLYFTDANGGVYALRLD